MPIGAVLVDRATVLRLQDSGDRVDGRTSRAWVESGPFRCRLFVNAAGENEDGPRGYRRALSYPQLLVGVKYLDGESLSLTFDDRVRVTSTEQGESSIWKVNGQPQPLRKKRRVIGYLAVLERTLEREFEGLV